MQIKTVHLGEDYGEVKVGGDTYQTSLGLAEAILELEKTITINYYSNKDFPEVGSIIERDGKKYKVTDNAVINQTTAVEVE